MDVKELANNLKNIFERDELFIDTSTIARWVDLENSTHDPFPAHWIALPVHLEAQLKGECRQAGYMVESVREKGKFGYRFTQIPRLQ